MYDVIIIGAGPSGLLAAGRAAQSGHKVLVIEKMKQAGRKLSITGKGRCNITNDASQSVYFKNIYPSGKFLKHAFSNFFSNDIIEILNKSGVPTTTERGNRIFPTSNKATDVLNGLLKWLKQYHCEIIYQTAVKQIIFSDNCIEGVRILKGEKEEVIKGKNVIICTGGMSYPATGSTGDGYQLARNTGHTIIKPRPALVPLVTKGYMAGELQGLSLKNVNAILWVNNKKYKEEFGEMLFTHYGLSGPIILTLSRFAVNELLNNNKVEISIDLKPALDQQKLDNRLLRDLNENGKKQIENILKLWVPMKFIPVFLKHLNIDGKKQGHQLNGKERKKILNMLKNQRFQITGHRGFKEAIITAGGVNLQEIDSKTMESKLIKNLYFAGEVIDLDANTGGYNLQIAFSTAWLAAQSCVI